MLVVDIERDDLGQAHRIGPTKRGSNDTGVEKPSARLEVGEEGHMGLSETVLAAVVQAARLIEDLVAKLLRGDKLEEALESTPKGTT